MKCPYCKKEIPSRFAASTLGSIRSKKKAEASRNNGKKGGRPRKNLRKEKQS